MIEGLNRREPFETGVPWTVMKMATQQRRLSYRAHYIAMKLHWQSYRCTLPFRRSKPYESGLSSEARDGSRVIYKRRYRPLAQAILQ